MATEGVDYEEIAKGIAEIREMLGAMVAGVMADGFDEEQARIIVTSFFASMGKNTGASDD